VVHLIDTPKYVSDLGVDLHYYGLKPMVKDMVRRISHIRTLLILAVSNDDGRPRAYKA
jgi:hypothetical protein